MIVTVNTRGYCAAHGEGGVYCEGTTHQSIHITGTGTQLNINCS